MVTPGAAQRRFPVSFKLPTDNARSLPDVVTAAFALSLLCFIWHALLTGSPSVNVRIALDRSVCQSKLSSNYQQQGEPVRYGTGEMTQCGKIVIGCCNPPHTPTVSWLAALTKTGRQVHRPQLSRL
jgi:hypothetical protein